MSEQKTLTIKKIPEHVLKLKELKEKIDLEQQKEKNDKPVPLYKKDYVVKAFDWLYKTFPKCFTQKDQKPLKINILQDILEYIDQHQNEEAPSKRGVRSALSTYVRNRYYLKACIKDAMRIDLEGCKISPISDEEALYAKQLYDKYTDVLKKRKFEEKKKTRRYRLHKKT